MIDSARQRQLVQLVCNAMEDVVPELIRCTKEIPGFKLIGSRMIWEWDAGLKRLSERMVLPHPSFIEQAMEQGITQPPSASKFQSARIGQFPLLAPRNKRAMITPAS